MDYLDFDLEIGPKHNNVYPLTLHVSPAGTLEASLTYPFDPTTQEIYLLKLHQALNAGPVKRRISPQHEQNVREFGEHLFDALFAGELRARYHQSLLEVATQDKGLRIKLRVTDPELSTLPWEYLYDSLQGVFLCLSRLTPLVRYLDLPQPPRPLQVELPLRILAMIASPSDQDPLDVEGEKTRMQQALAGPLQRGLVELSWLPGQTARDLQRCMRQPQPWHIFHFIGHSDFDPRSDEGVVALANEAGKTHPLSASDFGLLLADHRSLRLVLLNSCKGGFGSRFDLFSSLASTLVQRGLPAVLAMQADITDHAATEFTRAFYEALADREPVEGALAEARKAMRLGMAHTLEWGTPVLYLRAADGVLFHLGEQPRQAEPAVVTVRVNSTPEKTRQEGLREGSPRIFANRNAEAVAAFEQVSQQLRELTGQATEPPVPTIPAPPHRQQPKATALAAANDEAMQEAQQSLGDASYPATAGQLLEHARRKKVTRRIITWLETIEVTTVFASVAVAIERYRRHRGEAKASDEEQTITIAPSAEARAEAEEETLPPAPAGRRVTTSIKITDFQRHLHGIHYPVNRAQLLERAQANNAPENMIARLGELDETYTFHGVTEVMRGYVFYHYLRNISYPANRDQLLTEARSRKATRSLLTWLEGVYATMIFSSRTEAMQSYARYKVAEAEVEAEVEEVEEEEGQGKKTFWNGAFASWREWPQTGSGQTASPPFSPSMLTLAPRTQASVDDEEEEEAEGGTRVRRIRITEFQHYLKGTDYPADRTELLENARKNNASKTMLTALEELDPTYEFTGVRDVMRGYSYHRYLYGISYPTTREELLERARANKASSSLTRWLEGLSDTASFASMGDVLKSASKRSYTDW